MIYEGKTYCQSHNLDIQGTRFLLSLQDKTRLAYSVNLASSTCLKPIPNESHIQKNYTYFTRLHHTKK
jgi:hypothetical protein